MLDTSLTAAIPAQFDFSYGFGEGEHSYLIRWDGERLVYEHIPYTGARRIIAFRPQPHEWLTLWQHLDALDVWSWPAEFDTAHSATDGIWWDVDVEVGPRTLHARGYNVWPPGGVFGKPTPLWIGFAGAVSQLIGGQPFGDCWWTGTEIQCWGFWEPAGTCVPAPEPTHL